MAKLNIPDVYAMERGGWSNTSTLKSVYQQTFDTDRQRIDQTIDDYFQDIYDTKYDMKNIKQRKNVVWITFAVGSSPVTSTSTKPLVYVKWRR